MLSAEAGCEGDRLKGSEGDCRNGVCFVEACLLLSATASGGVTPTAVVAGMPLFTACTGLLHVTALTGRLPANVHESASDEGVSAQAWRHLKLIHCCVVLLTCCETAVARYCMAPA